MSIKKKNRTAPASTNFRDLAHQLDEINTAVDGGDDIIAAAEAAAVSPVFLAQARTRLAAMKTAATEATEAKDRVIAATEAERREKAEALENFERAVGRAEEAHERWAASSELLELMTAAPATGTPAPAATGTPADSSPAPAPAPADPAADFNGQILSFLGRIAGALEFSNRAPNFEARYQAWVAGGKKFDELKCDGKVVAPLIEETVVRGGRSRTRIVKVSSREDLLDPAVIYGWKEKDSIHPVDDRFVRFVYEREYGVI